MASTTEELTGQSDQLMHSLGFFRTTDSGTAAPVRAAAPRPNASLGKLREAVAPAAARPSSKSAKPGVALQMRDGDQLDKEFERY